MARVIVVVIVIVAVAFLVPLAALHHDRIATMRMVSVRLPAVAWHMTAWQRQGVRQSESQFCMEHSALLHQKSYIKCGRAVGIGAVLQASSFSSSLIGRISSVPSLVVALIHLGSVVLVLVTSYDARCLALLDVRCGKTH